MAGGVAGGFEQRRLLLFVTILLASVGCDHAAKQLAHDTLTNAPGVSVAADSVRFELVSNHGAFLSLGENLPVEVRRLLLLVGVPVLLVIACVFFLHTGFSSTAAVAALGLIAGGGTANWLDRLVNDGAVTDYVSVGLGPLRTGIFNLADVLIIAGVALLLLLPTAWGGPKSGGVEPDLP